MRLGESASTASTIPRHSSPPYSLETQKRSAREEPATDRARGSQARVPIDLSAMIRCQNGRWLVVFTLLFLYGLGGRSSSRERPVDVFLMRDRRGPSRRDQTSRSLLDSSALEVGLDVVFAGEHARLQCGDEGIRAQLHESGGSRALLADQR